MPSSSLSTKPARGRPKDSTSTCSFCKVAGHTKTTCPKRKTALMDPTVKAAFAAVFDVQQNLPVAASPTCEDNPQPLPP
ncbi:hypothetical protein GEMRC1_008004 [Eukaryota sp. GEM-RC1]